MSRIKDYFYDYDLMDEANNERESAANANACAQIEYDQLEQQRDEAYTWAIAYENFRKLGLSYTDSAMKATASLRQASGLL